MSTDDGYGRTWDYRVFSSQHTCPDDWNVGQRYLSVHQVSYWGRGAWMGRWPDYPLPEDLNYVEAEPASPSGVGIEEALLDAERIQAAFNRPALIRAEFREHFEWSEKQNKRNDEEHAAALRGKVG